MSKTKLAPCPLQDSCPESAKRRELLQRLGATAALAAAGPVLGGLTGCDGGSSNTIGAGAVTTIPQNSATNTYTLTFTQFPALEEDQACISVIIDAVSATQTLYVTRIDANTCYAVSNICTHAGTVLNVWDPSGQDYYCSSHGAKFSYEGVATTQPTSGTAGNLTAYQGTITATGITFMIE